MLSGKLYYSHRLTHIECTSYKRFIHLVEGLKSLYYLLKTIFLIGYAVLQLAQTTKII